MKEFDEGLALRIGIDLGGTKIEGIVMDADGEVLCTRRRPTPADYQGSLNEIADLVAELRASAGSERPARRVPVGLGAPGHWSRASLRMRNCNSTWLNEQPLLTDLRALLGPVRIANDADCFALSEAVSGNGRNAHVVFGVILGTGVGGGVVVERQLISGPNGLTGEWGHTPLPYFRCDPSLDDTLDEVEGKMGDRACYCGRTNCIETFLSGPGLVRSYAEISGRATGSARDVVDDTSFDARLSLRIYRRMLARSLAQIINVIDPEVIVAGGGLSNVPAVYAGLLEQCVQYAFTETLETSIVPAHYGDSSGVRGAAWLWPAGYTGPDRQVGRQD